MLTGDNGILQKATTAKENTDNSQIKEKIQLAYHSALTGGQGSYTKESLEEELEKEFGENNYNVDDSDNTNWILTAQGQSITIAAGKSVAKRTITFYVGSSPECIKATYTAEEGMTFGEWFEKYSPENITINTYTYEGTTYHRVRWDGCDLGDYYNYTACMYDTVIQDGALYQDLGD